MNILLVNQFYPPSLAPTGKYLQDLAVALADRGHSVTVVCSRSDYGSGTAGKMVTAAERIRVIRIGAVSQVARNLPAKAVGYAGFLAAAGWTLFRIRPRPDVVLAMTTPPWIGLAAAAAGRRSARVHWVMDLYPQVLAAHNLLREDSLAYRFLRRMTRREWRRSGLIVTPGAGMAERIRCDKLVAPDTQLEEIPLWLLDSHDPWPQGKPVPLRRERAWPADETVLMYSGNMGLGHEIQAFLKAALKAKPEEAWRMVFAGWGKRQAEVENFIRRHPGTRVEPLPVACPHRLREHLASADVHLVSMRPEWSGLIVPSKVQAAFGAGRPVVFVGPQDSDPARWIRESGGGWSLPPEDEEGLLHAIRESCNPEERQRKGAAAYQYACRCFDRDKNRALLVEWIENCAVKRHK